MAHETMTQIGRKYSGLLARRWTHEQREQAESIVNDIAEDIDNGESRSELRQALAIYADYLSDAMNVKSCEQLKVTVNAINEMMEIWGTNNTEKQPRQCSLENLKD